MAHSECVQELIQIEMINKSIFSMALVAEITFFAFSRLILRILASLSLSDAVNNCEHGFT